MSSHAKLPLAVALLIFGLLANPTPAAADGDPGTAPQAPPTAAGPLDAQLGALADDYFDRFYFPENPSAATSYGVHKFDDRLEDYSRAGVERQVKALHGYEARFAAIDPAGLSEQAAGDRELLLSNVRSTLLSLEAIRGWEKNPDNYSSGITSSAYSRGPGRPRRRWRSIRPAGLSSL